MNLFDIQLTAGIESQTTISGRYFRILTGVGRIRMKASNGKDSAILAGIGVDVGPFEWIRLTSDTNQTITVLVSDLPTTDSRLAGDVDISGKLEVVNAPGNSFLSGTVALPGAAAVEVLTTRATRLSGTIQADVDLWLGHDMTVDDTTGIIVTAGSTVNIDNRGSLFAYSAAAGTVRVMESNE